MSRKKRNIPQHIAIIMDGNGRWAQQRGFHRAQGHRAGVESVREVVDSCIDMGIHYLTLYAFSSENWKRPKREIVALMRLLERFLKEQTPQLMEQNVRLKVIGQVERLPNYCRHSLESSCQKTASNKGLTLTLALSYGGREEIVYAAQKLALAVENHEIDSQAITPEIFERYLWTAGMPDPDLVIRTSGEMRLSNFLLWQASYAEISIVPKLWPDFRGEDLREVLAEYGQRERRFGAL